MRYKVLWAIRGEDFIIKATGDVKKNNRFALQNYFSEGFHVIWRCEKIGGWGNNWEVVTGIQVRNSEGLEEGSGEVGNRLTTAKETLLIRVSIEWR